MESRKPVIGYLLKTFPKLSETFILNEMLELERQDITLHVFSLRRSQDQRHHPAVEQLKAPVTYLPSLLPTWHREDATQLLNCLTWWGQRDCAALVETLQFYCDRPEDRRFNEFLQGCYLAELVEQLGITHLHAHFANIPAATAEIAQQLDQILSEEAETVMAEAASEAQIPKNRTANSVFSRRLCATVSASAAPVR